MRLLPLFALLLSQFSLAQTDGHGELGPDELDYYLYQALHAPLAGQRLALNHIGVQLQDTERGYLVTAVLEGYPAQAAGIYRGDIIEQADDQPFHPVFSFNQADLAPDNFTARSASVRLTVRRDEDELNLDVRPVFENLFDSYRSASLNSIQQFASGNKMLGYLRLWVLSRSTADLIAYQNLFAALARTDGIILDLRDALGFMDQTQLQLIYRGASNLFTSSEQKSTVNADADSYPLTAAQDAYRNPVAILVNEYTRGGAELLAYQLDKLSRVISLGQTTAGELGDWRLLDDKLIYQAWPGLLIDNQAIEGQGFAPERPVDYPQQQTGRIDPQFQAAMDLLMGII